MDAYACAMETSTPTAAAISTASRSSSWGGRAAPLLCTMLMNRMLENAPMIMMPSSAILTTPLRSLNIPPNATISSGMEKNIVCCTRKYTVFIQLRPLPAGPCPKQRACRPPRAFLLCA